MRAVVLVGPRRLELREVADAEIAGETEVLLKIGCVGICGSDIHYYTQGRIGSQIVQYPFVLGHELSATVVKAGGAVRHVRPGDRVTVDPAIPCGGCDQCRIRRAHTCRNLRFLGCPGQAAGCLSEYLVMPAACCFPVKPQTTLEEAAFVEPLSIGLYATRLSVPMTGARVAVLGCGPIGLSVVLHAKLQGAAAVYVTDKIDGRLAAARQAGASWAGNPMKQDIVRAITEKEPLLLDAVFECCGQQEALDQAVALLKPGGKLVLVGIPTVERVSFAIDPLRRKEIVVQNVRRQNECVQAALELLESGRLRVDQFITHRFSLEQTAQAFELVAAYRDGVIKAMIHVS